MPGAACSIWPGFQGGAPCPRNRTGPRADVRRAAADRRSRRVRDFLGRLIPVLSALFAKATPDGIREVAEVDDLVQRAFMSGREAGFWDILPGSADLAPITDTARDYGEKLKQYRNGEISREHLERDRRAGIQRITEFVNVLKPTAKGVEVV